MEPIDHSGRGLLVQAGAGKATTNFGRAAELNKRFVELHRTSLEEQLQPPKSAAVVIPPLTIALERWVNEGGTGDDPDDTAGLSPAQTPPRLKGE